MHTNARPLLRQERRPERRRKTELNEAIRGRRSIRRFEKGVVIPEGDIIAIMEAATWAPSSTNTQPWRFILVTQPELIARMARAVLDRCQELSRKADETGERRLATFFRFMRSYGGFFGDASAVVVACAERYDVGRFGLDEHLVSTILLALDGSKLGPMLTRTVEKSVVMAVQNLLLKAYELGYGSCAMDAPLIVEDELRRLLDIPQSQQLVMLVPLGVPAQVPAPPARMPANQVVRYV